MTESLRIEDLAPLGDGISPSEKGRIYVDRTLPGDVVTARVHKAGGMLRGDLLAVVEPSPHRVQAPCAHYDICGGCTLQHASEAFYRDWKTGVVRTALARQGLAPELWHDPVFLPAATRRRATFAAVRKKDRVTLGYFRRRSHAVADIASCLTADPALMALRDKLSRPLAPLLTEKPADIFIQMVGGGAEVVITGPLGRKGVPDLQVYEAAAEIAHGLGINRIAWRAREQDAPDVLLEVTPLIAMFGALSVALPPLAFLQPTKAGEDALAAAVMAALPASGTFADLFAGCGTFTGPMLARGSVDAFENAALAVRALDKAKGTAPVTAVRRDLFRDPVEGKRYDAVVFDPPRLGAEAQSKALAVSDVPRVVGVSCNPVTFARDARILVEGGYRLESVRVVDQFIWSHHVELVGVFSR
ncbi:MAG: class I SAM-dependent RNA methyltransferase [Rhodospirillaceae bacterium]|nr:class I SAM-dependent RNA methyltransferase [Rhodospirillaceae bacterium]